MKDPLNVSTTKKINLNIFLDKPITISGTILMASVISMSAITYDRLTAIVLPNDTRINDTKAKIIIPATWVIGTVLSIPLAFYRTYKVNIYIFYLKYMVLIAKTM